MQLTDLGEQYREMQRAMRLAHMSEAEQKFGANNCKKQAKDYDKLKKQNARSSTIEVTQPCLYALDFKGRMDANEVTSLREEIF